MRQIFRISTTLALTLGITACSGQADSPVASSDAVQTAAQRPAPNPTKNAYFGDTHVHTKNSFDAYIVGTRADADDAYRFAKGAPIDNGEGKTIRLDGPPLDFYSVTDHGEYMGVIAEMTNRGSDIAKTETAKSIFGLNTRSRAQRRESFLRIGRTVVSGEPIDDIYDRAFIDSAWAQNVAAAEKHNQPGVFTTFAGYEFTAMAAVDIDDDNAGALNLHRNVIFKDTAPKRLFSTLDSPNPEDLWTWMNSQRAQGHEALAIPHNSNASNGLMFDRAMTAGEEFDKTYAENRILNEPLVEISQLKGTSETHPEISPNDEWANFELYDMLIGMPVRSTVKEGSFVRPSLARGIGIEAEIGANPYQFGLIGASDTHIGGPSLSEENHFGKFSSDLNLDVRASVPPNGAKTWPADFKTEDEVVAVPQYGASGIAGVWAEENTRDSLFKAMRAKEVFGTSGPRLRVRMFASYDYDADILSASNMLTRAYAKGVPMGAEIATQSGSPSFIAWATQDPQGQSLQRLQMVKVWSEAGAPKEAIYDIACAGGISPDKDARCPDNGASVDLDTCKTNAPIGDAELSTVWKDPSYQPDQSAAYYVRVLENPKCRWSTWDAVRNGTPPNPNMHATLQDRAWGSPIWVKPQ